jgi:hypothetical protein
MKDGREFIKEGRSEGFQGRKEGRKERNAPDLLRHFLARLPFPFRHPSLGQQEENHPFLRRGGGGREMKGGKWREGGWEARGRNEGRKEGSMEGSMELRKYGRTI